jgi:hypothetical protein
MSEDTLFSTDIIKAQVQNLIVGHSYRILYTLHYTNKSHTAYLDKNTLEFTANNSIQNIFVVVTKDIRIKNLLLQIKALDLDKNSILIYNNFINCEGFNECEPAYPSPTPTPTVTPTPTPTNI